MTIDSVKYGEVVLGGKTFYSDLIVWWDNKQEMIRKNHLLDFSLLMRLLKRKPDAIIVGVGFVGTVTLLPEFTQKLEDKGVRLFVETTENAVEVFNAFCKEGKHSVAVLHVNL